MVGRVDLNLRPLNPQLCSLPFSHVLFGYNWLYLFCKYQAKGKSFTACL